MNDRQREAIQESLAEFGQVADLLVRPHPEIPGDYQIIDGEHRFRGDEAPEVFVTVLEGLEDPEARKLTVVMNETRGNADLVELSKLIAQLHEDLGADVLVGLPYDERDLEEFIRVAQVDWDQWGQGDDEDEEDQEGYGEGGGPSVPSEVLTMTFSHEDYQRLCTARERLGLQGTDAWSEVVVLLVRHFLGE